MNTIRSIVIAGALLLMLGSAHTAVADSTVNGTLNLGATGWNANASLSTVGGTSGTWSLTFDYVNGTSGTVDINSFAVQLFNAGSSETFNVTSATLNGSSSLGNWEFFADDKLNMGSSSDCSSTSVKGWLCGDTGKPALKPYVLASGATAEFILSGTYSGTTAINPLDLMASGCLVAGTCKLDGGSNDLNKWAVSNSMLATPEPGSVFLVGGALILAGILKRR
jgi:hypothetical protein